MKLKTLLFVCVLIVFSCVDKENKSTNTETELRSYEIEIEDIKSLDGQSGRINAQLEKFDMGKMVNRKSNHRHTTDKILKKDFINVSGIDLEGNTIAYRQEIELRSMGNKYVITFVQNGTGETCIGVNCSNCIIKEGGGCDCNDNQDAENNSYCNHTISSGNVEN